MPNPTRLVAQAAVVTLRNLLVRVTPGDRAWMAAQIMQDRFHPSNRALAGFCVSAVHAWKNRQYDVTRNGETALLERLRPFRPRLVLDVGANVGDWTIAASRSLPEVTVHAFEAAPHTAELLARNLAAQADRVVINATGLSDHAGWLTLYATPDDTTKASIVPDVARAVAEQGWAQVEAVTVQTVTGDAYLREHQIDHVDMLKIDVEGAEFSVLRGFADAFARHAIDLVQFEYGQLNVATRDFLGDFYRFFTDRGFIVGKLFPEGVSFKSYELDDEDFLGPNYLACSAARTDLIEALRCPPLVS